MREYVARDLNKQEQDEVIARILRLYSQIDIKDMTSAELSVLKLLAESPPLRRTGREKKILDYEYYG